MKRNLFFAVVGLMLLAACHKEDDGRVQFVIEPMDSHGTKLAIVDDTHGVWSDGDVVNFNGVPVAIRRASAESAYADVSNARSVNSACFPADMTTDDLSAATVTMTIPSVHHYRTDDEGRQVIALPMAARESGTALRFTHLTAALCLIISNDRTDNKTLVVDSLVVSSSAYQLSGERNVDMNNLASLSPQPLDGGSRVTVFFDRQRLELAPGASRKVIVPVLPVGSDNHFTVTVASRYQGSRYNYSRTQGQGGALSRNMLAYAAMSLGMDCSVTRLFPGNGTSSDPFILSNASDLIALSDVINGDWSNYKTLDYRLTQDIDMTGIDFTPIAILSGSIFDGNHKTIHNLNIVGTNKYMALFGELSPATVKNLTLNNVTVKCNFTSSASEIGCLCATMSNSTLDNCDVTGVVKTLIENVGNNYCYYGTFAASVAPDSNIIKNCTANYSHTTSTTASTFYYGGLVGQAPREGSLLRLQNCSVANPTLNITDAKSVRIGGLIGYVYKMNVDITDCRWLGAMTVNSSQNAVYAGGVIGQLNEKNTSACVKFTRSNSVSGSIAVTAGGTAPSYVGAYVAYMLPLPTPTSSCVTDTNNIDRSSLTMTLNGNTVDKNYGNQ